MLRLTGLLLALGLGIAVMRCRGRRAQPPRLRSASSSSLAGEPVAFVSIIVPARDEEHTIEGCVRSLLAQDYPRFEVIAVNDRSRDATGTILDRLAAGDPRLTVIRGEALPPGWLGKAYAIAQAYRRARGEWLLFSDADTVHAPWLLSSVMAELRHSPASFASACGTMRHPDPATHLINLAVLVSRFLTAQLAMLPAPSAAHSAVTGQYVIFTREAYESIGTHEAVRKYASTEMSLEYLARLQGWLPALFDARDGLQTRMYGSGGEAFRGSSRNLVNRAWTLSGRAWGSLTLAVQALTMFAVWIAPSILIGRSLWVEDGIALVLGVMCAIASLALMYLYSRSVLGPREARPWVAAGATLAMPVSSAIFVAMAAAGLAEAFWRGGMVWKGRVVRTPDRLPQGRRQPPKPRRGPALHLAGGGADAIRRQSSSEDP